MEVIVDSSVIVAVISREPVAGRLVELTRSHTLVAPLSIHHEIGNAFSAMLKRKRATIEEVLIALDQYAGIPLRLVDVELGESLRIAHLLNLYAYDAYLICCAHQHQSPLLTLDRRLRMRAQEYGVQVMGVDE